MDNGRRPYTNVELLIIINFLHFISTGIMVTVLSRHIGMLGGNNTLLAILHCIVFIVQALTPDILAMFTHGKKLILTCCLYFCFVCNFILVFFNDWLTSSLIKCLLGLSSGVIGTTKQYAEGTEPQEEHIKIFNTLDTVKVGGYIVGSLLGGHLYDCDVNLISNAMVASCLSLICILVVQEIAQDDPGVSGTDSNLRAIPQMCASKLKGLKEINLVEKLKKMDATAVQLAFVACSVFYLTRYIQILCVEFDLTAAPAAYITAFEHFLTFFWSCIVPFAKEKCEDKQLLTYNSLAITTLLMAGTIYAPSLSCHTIISIPMYYTYTLSNSLLEDDAFNTKGEGMEDAISTLTVVFNLIIPILTGIISDLVPIGVLKLCVFLPVTACVLTVGHHLAN